MTRTKAPRKATAPHRSPAAAAPMVIKFPVPGHARGAAAYIAMRRRGDRWAVVDSNRGDWNPEYWNGREWLPLTDKAPAAEAYRWTRPEAKTLAEKYVAQAAEIHQHYATLSERAQRIEKAAAELHPVGEVPAVVTLQEVQARLAVAQAEVGARHAKPSAPVVIPEAVSVEQAEAELDAATAAICVEIRAEVAAEQLAAGISVPAPKDVPGYGETPGRMAETVKDTTLHALAEVDEDQELLTALGRSIPATTAEVEPVEAQESDAEATQLVDVAELRKLTGNDDTQTIPVIVESEAEAEPEAVPEPEFVIPPLPAEPPIICPADTTIRAGVTVQFAKPGATP